MKWGCFDYSQQEPRLVAHYALRFGLSSVNQIADSMTQILKQIFTKSLLTWQRYHVVKLR